MTREDVINLLIKMIEYNQRPQAIASYTLAHSTHPEWELHKAPELIALKAKQ